MVEIIDQAPNKGRVFFNTGQAVTRLIAGEPAQYVFGLTFGWPINPLTQADLENPHLLVATGVEKAIVNTLLTAEAGDVVGVLSQSPLLQLGLKTPYTLESPVSSSLTEEVFIPILEDVFRQTRAIAGQAQTDDSMLSQVMKACGPLLSPVTDSVAKTVRDKIQRGVGTAEDKMPVYVQLIRDVYMRENSEQEPTIDQLCGLVDDSYAVLGRPASRDVKYLLKHYDLKVTLLSKNLKFYYDPSHYELRTTVDGRMRVVLRNEPLQEIETSYAGDVRKNPQTQVDVITGCPANVAVGKVHGQSKKFNLMETMLDRFQMIVRHNAT